ncbi:hypothetical protein SAMN05444285_10917 [Draconibacterium orientale]|uniref:Uncharacterized protein n=1 Tax=Draconibacterium orientale TaxID=1168034 RepID=X5DKK3_9BACT|nr:hypothetical protein [Draconibacterium orientale]AHW61704.1 hypothetical protein FH5T_06845 [Draconibacterium orientale]SET26351.1 hypothetical protein SAMN05444285_10917 [Draconibacterium orientale]
MKKQILILTFFVAAIFAGTSSYGQDVDYVNASATDCVTPTPLTCVTNNNELAPIPGKTYTYGINVSPTVTTGNIQWFVYNATTTGGIISAYDISTAAAAAEADGGTSLFLLDAEDGIYNQSTGNDQATIDISWQSFNGTSNIILLVAYVEGEDGCSDNIEVYRIEPAFAFTLDIAGMFDDGTIPASGNANECVSPVQSASYASDVLTMDYGQNYIYFSVNAANFVNSWMPTFSVEDNTTGATVTTAEISWAYPDQAILGASGAATGTWNSASTAVDAQATTGAVGPGGECIVVRVLLDYGNVENDVASHFTLGVNGIMYDPSDGGYDTPGLADLDPVASAPCTNTATDVATYDMTPRPNITTNTTVGTGDKAFEPKN